MMNALNKLESAVREYNDILDTVLCVSFNDDKNSLYFLNLKNLKCRPLPDWTWKANR